MVAGANRDHCSLAFGRKIMDYQWREGSHDTRDGMVTMLLYISHVLSIISVFLVAFAAFLLASLRNKKS